MVVAVRPRAPWYTDEIASVKRVRRKLEHKWLRSGLCIDHDKYKEQCHMVSDVILESKQIFYNRKITEANGNQKELFSVIDSIFKPQLEPQLPPHDDVSELTDRFANFFVSKISGIRESFAKKYLCSQIIHGDNLRNIPHKLKEFTPASVDEVCKLISASPCKSCSLDPIPTWLTKKCIDVLAPIITMIVNLSLSSGEMPSDFKEAILRPLLKKICLDPDILNNFRPISNLMYVSKLIERVVATRLHSHMESNKLYEEFQSSYRKCHGTETALTCVNDDILRAIDENKSVLLVMLDLSAAFDTVDHNILLHRLEHRLGISGVALQWFQSYLTKRTQTVAISGVKSKSIPLDCGVPQGSVLGPILFTIYMLPLGDLIKRYGIQFHMYADDCQLYTICNSPDLDQSAESMECLINDIRQWYSQNMLKLNDSKTEMLIIKSKFRQKVTDKSIKIGDLIIPSSSSIRNLGVLMDPVYTMAPHVNHMAQIAFLKIREISYFRRYLTDESTKTAVHAYITSKLDYCNSLLYGLPDALISKLQSAMNTAARLVTKTRKFDHISPVLKKLHWLPVKFRTEYKILLLVFKCINGLAPVYLSKRLCLKSKKGLRSDNKLYLSVPLTKLKTKTYGDRCFSIAGPTLWNDLPCDLRLSKSIDIFKKNLKTYLFKKAFTCL